jgi:hypothetical protein
VSGRPSKWPQISHRAKPARRSKSAIFFCKSFSTGSDREPPAFGHAHIHVESRRVLGAIPPDARSNSPVTFPRLWC